MNEKQREYQCRVENRRLRITNLKRCRICNEIRQLGLFHNHASSCTICRPLTSGQKRILENKANLTENKHRCIKCNVIQPITEYDRSGGYLRGECKSCGVIRRAKERGFNTKGRKGYDLKEIRASGNSRCFKCKKIKPISEFSTKLTICKFCKKAERAETRNTQARKQQIEKTKDGSLSGSYLEYLLWTTDFCPYCGKCMSEGEKVLDHIIPLSKDGSHAWYNVTVCCKRCNSKKWSKLIVNPLVLPITQILKNDRNRFKQAF